MTNGGHLKSLDQVPAAQTSVELFNQLQAQNASDGELATIRAALKWAMAFFAGRMHASGKLYLNHCVGAASVLAGVGAPAHVVAAGLVHGAYRWGDFGPWRVSRALRRRRLAADLGADVEALVHRFETLPWSTEAVADLRDRLTELDPITRTVVLMRLASDLDNMRDRGMLFCNDADRRRQMMERKGPLLVEMAEKLDVPQLGRALAAAVAETLQDSVPAELRWHRPTGALLPPASAQRKLGAVLAAIVAGGVRRGRHQLARGVRSAIRDRR
jgi:(p)ppGpp synthase/HD superfamily hydrolase